MLVSVVTVAVSIIGLTALVYRANKDAKIEQDPLEEKGLKDLDQYVSLDAYLDMFEEIWKKAHIEMHPRSEITNPFDIEVWKTGLNQLEEQINLKACNNYIKRAASAYRVFLEDQLFPAIKSRNEFLSALKNDSRLKERLESLKDQLNQEIETTNNEFDELAQKLIKVSKGFQLGILSDIDWSNAARWFKAVEKRLNQLTIGEKDTMLKAFNEFKTFHHTHLAQAQKTMKKIRVVEDLLAEL